MKPHHESSYKHPFHGEKYNETTKHFILKKKKVEKKIYIFLYTIYHIHTFIHCVLRRRDVERSCDIFSTGCYNVPYSTVLGCYGVLLNVKHCHGILTTDIVCGKI